jgi:DNA polymerase III subunit delta'
MSFDAIIGNTPAKLHLDKLLLSGRIPHLLLFTGIEGIGKRLFAEEFAAAWLISKTPGLICKRNKDGIFHPDLCLCKVEGKIGMHSIQSVRKMIEQIEYAPFEAKGRAIIIDDAHRMLAASANALLKTLEEPPAHTLIILVTSEPERLLDTIVSRCQKIRFNPLSKEELTQALTSLFSFDNNSAITLAESSNGSLSCALSLRSQKDSDLQTKLVHFLANGTCDTFITLSDAAKVFATTLDNRKKDIEAYMREEVEESTVDMSSQQKGQLEQDIEGAITLTWMKEVEQFLKDILAYFRDVTALGVGMGLDTLILPKCHEAIKDSSQKGRIKISLDEVEKALLSAKQAIERSTPLTSVLETLFLKLGLYL